MAARRQAWRSGWRPWVALALGYLLVLQALVSGLAVAGHAAAVDGASLAAVICTPDGIRPVSGPEQGPGQGHDMGCCLIGCSATGPGTAPPPAAALPVVAGVSERPSTAPADHAAVGRWRSPLSPRAPPRPV